MVISTRPTTAEDTAFARAVHHAAYHDVVVTQFGDWDEDRQDRFFENDWAIATFVILLADGVPCGYAAVEERSADTHVRELVVDPSWQNKGIGTSFLRQVMAESRARELPVRLGACIRIAH